MSMNELTAKVAELRELRRMAEEIAAEIATIEDQIKANMAALNTDELHGSTFKITWKSVTSSRLDSKALKADALELPSGYSAPVWGFVWGFGECEPAEEKRKTSETIEISEVLLGAAIQIRTGDLILTKDALYLLSYSSISDSFDIIARLPRSVKSFFRFFFFFRKKFLDL